MAHQFAREFAGELVNWGYRIGGKENGIMFQTFCMQSTKWSFHPEEKNTSERDFSLKDNFAACELILLTSALKNLYSFQNAWYSYAINNIFRIYQEPILPSHTPPLPQTARAVWWRCSHVFCNLLLIFSLTEEIPKMMIKFPIRHS